MKSADARSRLAGPLPDLAALLPGLLLTGTIVALAHALRVLPVAALLSPMIIATLLGMVLGNVVRLPGYFEAGSTFASRVLLRVAIVLLGLQLTVQDLIALGSPALLVAIALPVATLLFALWVGKRLGVGRDLTELIAMGTAVCGASAIAATREVNRAGGEDVAYALISITLFGSIAMLALPAVSSALGLTEIDAAVWGGASIHEIAQVAGASFQYSEAAGRDGMVVKLARVMTLAPLLLLLAGPLSQKLCRSDAKTPPAVPGFVLLFAAMVALNSALQLPAEVRGMAAVASGAMMAMALAALGLQSDFARLRLRGMRPLMLGALASLFIAGAGLAAVLSLNALAGGMG